MSISTLCFEGGHFLIRRPSLYIVSIVLTLFLSGTCMAASDHQKMIHEMGHSVMPFDLSKTTHIFEMTETGGIQQVIVKDPKDTEQIRLMRQHLHHEAMRFQRGDFSDPASLHGTSMPGLKELAAGASKMTIEYSEIPDGGQITFTTHDIHLLTAVHRWFGAQLSDHGRDATYR